MTEKYFIHHKHLLSTLSQNLSSKNPNKPLEKGYVRVWQDGKWVRSNKNLDPHTKFELEWLDGKQKMPIK